MAKIKETKPDMVNSPPHYNREGAMECIEEMIVVFGREKTATYCLLNVWKYRNRAMEKNGKEDMAKSDWYMKKYKELTEGSKVTLLSHETGRTNG